MIKDIFSLYIHIPFCASKCFYCDFNSYAEKEAFIKPYFRALTEEITLYAPKVKREIASIYIGGGTPSFPESAYITQTLKAVRDNYRLNENCEISMEANPDSLTYDKLCACCESGVNRISMGVQAAQDNILKSVGRAHTVSDALRAADDIKRAGIKNFNMDLMFSLPHQTMEDWRESLSFCADSGASHISAYSLTLAQNTPIYGDYESGRYIQNEALDRDMYHEAAHFLASRGFGRYEISNFALAGFECIHNRACWNACEYLGFGAGAHSFFAGERFANKPALCDYIKSAGKSQAREFTEKVTPQSLGRDYIMTSLRTAEGVDFNRYRNISERDFEEEFFSEINGLKNSGFVAADSDGMRLTEKGFDFADAVTLEFM